jgi:hypothetical protein
MPVGFLNLGYWKTGDRGGQVLATTRRGHRKAHLPTKIS